LRAILCSRRHKSTPVFCGYGQINNEERSSNTQQHFNNCCATITCLCCDFSGKNRDEYSTLAPNTKADRQITASTRTVQLHAVAAELAELQLYWFSQPGCRLASRMYNSFTALSKSLATAISTVRALRMSNAILMATVNTKLKLYAPVMCEISSTVVTNEAEIL